MAAPAKLEAGSGSDECCLARVPEGDIACKPLVSSPADPAASAAFRSLGYTIQEQVLPPPLCAALLSRLGAMLRGEFDTGRPPDKVPSAAAPARRRPRVEQFVNAWKGDALFAAVVQSEALAAWVASIAGWPGGAEVLQDQVWCKPPSSGPIGFHRDVAYMGEGVVTAWITLDDLEPQLGPLEYARGSHLWESPPGEGYAPALFGRRDYQSQLDKAAAYCGAAKQLEQVLVPQGGGSVHDGRTWHGSGVNRSGRPRRGLGIHFGPKGARPQLPTALARQMALSKPQEVEERADASSDVVPEPPAPLASGSDV